MKTYVGTSGFNYADWKVRFYPEGLPKTKWLEYYANQFPTVEINATFYRWFKKETFEKWRKQTSDNFVFAIKGPRRITHLQKLKDVDQITADFFENAKGLKEKLKVVLWQFPKNFHFKEEYLDRLENFLKILPEDIYQVFELRERSWYDRLIYHTLEKYGAGFVINDTQAFDTAEIITGDVVYIRFHGPTSLYSSKYSTEQLKVWAKKIKKYAAHYNVFAYFNNDVSAYAIENAIELNDLVKVPTL